MKTKQLAQWGLLLIALISLLSPNVTVQAQQPTSYSPPIWPYMIIHDGSSEWLDPSTYDYNGAHYGVDFDAYKGDSVYSVCGGEVIFYGDWKGWKNTIWIKCRQTNDWFGYSHLDDSQHHVIHGDSITIGQKIAEVGSIIVSGNGNRDHLHLMEMHSDPLTVDITTLPWVNPTTQIDASRSPQERLAETQSQAQLVQKVYNMKSNYGGYTNYRLNMLMTLWGVSPGSKTQGAYKNVPDSFEGQVEIPTGTTWLNGVFGPYTTEYGMGYSEVGGEKEGGGACDILSMVAETLDSVDKVTVDSYSDHDPNIPGVTIKYSLAVSTSKNLADPTTKNGADVRVVNNYGIITLHWKVEGDSLTLWVTGGKSTSQPSVVAQQPSSDASQFAPLKKWSGWILVILAVLFVVFFAPRAILRIGKPKTQGEVARKQDLWRGIIEQTVIIGIGLVIAVYFYAAWQWPDLIAIRRKVLLNFVNDSSSVPNSVIIAVIVLWLGSSLLRRLRESRATVVATEVKQKSVSKPLTLTILIVIGTLIGIYYFPNLYKPPVKAISPSTSSVIGEGLPPSVQYWSPEIYTWATKYGKNGAEDPMVGAVIMTFESCGRPTAGSSAGAQGLFQVMPSHWSASERNSSTMQDPEQNAQKGYTWLNTCFGLYYPEDPERAFGCYNGGSGGVSGPKSTWPAETQRYVDLTVNAYNELKASNGMSSTTITEWRSPGDSFCNQAVTVLSQAPWNDRQIPGLSAPTPTP